MTQMSRMVLAYNRCFVRLIYILLLFLRERKIEVHHTIKVISYQRIKATEQFQRNWRLFFNITFNRSSICEVHGLAYYTSLVSDEDALIFYDLFVLCPVFFEDLNAR